MLALVKRLRLYPKPTLPPLDSLSKSLYFTFVLYADNSSEKSVSRKCGSRKSML
jgi:hypothetical protein